MPPTRPHSEQLSGRGDGVWRGVQGAGVLQASFCRFGGDGAAALLRERLGPLLPKNTLSKSTLQMHMTNPSGSRRAAALPESAPLKKVPEHGLVGKIRRWQQHQPHTNRAQLRRRQPHTHEQAPENVAVPVVSRPFLGVRQRAVRLADRMELFLGRGVVGILVRVARHCERAVSSFNFRLCGVLVQPERSLEVPSLRHRHRRSIK